MSEMKQTEEGMTTLFRLVRILWRLGIREANSKYSLISNRAWRKATRTRIRWDRSENGTYIGKKKEKKANIGMLSEPCWVVSGAAGDG